MVRLANSCARVVAAGVQEAVSTVKNSILIVKIVPLVHVESKGDSKVVLS